MTLPKAVSGNLVLIPTHKSVDITLRFRHTERKKSAWKYLPGTQYPKEVRREANEKMKGEIQKGKEAETTIEEEEDGTRRVKLNIKIRTAEDKQVAWIKETAQVFQNWEKEQSKKAGREKAILAKRREYWEARAVKAKHWKHRARATAMAQRVQRQTRRMKERHAKANNDEGRRLTWAMERTGSASLYTR